LPSVAQRTFAVNVTAVPVVGAATPVIGDTVSQTGTVVGSTTNWFPTVGVTPIKFTVEVVGAVTSVGLTKAKPVTAELSVIGAVANSMPVLASSANHAKKKCNFRFFNICRRSFQWPALMLGLKPHIGTW
jgi:hypothetical protein